MDYTRRLLGGALLTGFALCAGASTARADYKAEALSRLDTLEKKMTGLATAVAADKYTWRPGEGARSVSELFLHVTSANYGIARSFGKQPPQGLDLSGLEKSTTDKAKIIPQIKASFEHMKAAVAALGDGDAAMKMFGQDTTVRGGVLMMLEHASEHLGQSIAYTRTTGAVPPWSQ